MQSYGRTSIGAAKNVASYSNREILWYRFGCTLLMSDFSLLLQRKHPVFVFSHLYQRCASINFYEKFTFASLAFDSRFAMSVCTCTFRHMIQSNRRCMHGSPLRIVVCTLPSNIEYLSISHGLTWKNNIWKYFHIVKHPFKFSIHANARYMNLHVSFSTWVARPFWIVCIKFIWCYSRLCMNCREKGTRGTSQTNEEKIPMICSCILFVIRFPIFFCCFHLLLSSSPLPSFVVMFLFVKLCSCYTGSYCLFGMWCTNEFVLLHVSFVVVNFCLVSLTYLVVNALSLVLCIVALMLLRPPPPPTPPWLRLLPLPLLLSITFVGIVAVNLTLLMMLASIVARLLRCTAPCRMPHSPFLDAVHSVFWWMLRCSFSERVSLSFRFHGTIEFVVHLMLYK